MLRISNSLKFIIEKETNEMNERNYKVVIGKKDENHIKK